MDYNADGRVSTYQMFCAQAEMRARMTLESLNQIAADASAIKGKKNLLWFSVGIPWITNPSAHAKCLPDYFSDLLKTYGLLAAAQIAVYPIDARGVPTVMPDTFITSTGRLLARDLTPPRQTLQRRANGLGDHHRPAAGGHGGAEAEATGGAAFYNSNDLPAGLIAKAVNTGSRLLHPDLTPRPGPEVRLGPTTTLKPWSSASRTSISSYRKDLRRESDPATHHKPAPGLTLTTSLPTPEPAVPTPKPPCALAMGRAMPASTDILFDVQVQPSNEPAKPSDPPVFGVLDPKLERQAPHPLRLQVRSPRPPDRLHRRPQRHPQRLRSVRPRRL